MSKYITKEEYIKAIESQEIRWIESAREDAEFIAERIKQIHPRAFGMKFKILSYNDEERQLKIVKNRLSEILPFLKFNFTPAGNDEYGTNYIIRWKLKEEDAENA